MSTARLLDKLEQARSRLGGQVFDVLGKLQFEGRSLRDLLIEAIRYGEQPEVRERLNQAVSHVFDRAELQDLLEEHALARDAMDASRVHRVREDMERAEARRLQPHYIESFFLEAFKHLSGAVRAARATSLPNHSASRPRCAIEIGSSASANPCFNATSASRSRNRSWHPKANRPAAFVCPGHPLLGLSDRPDPGATPRSAPPRCGLGRRARPGHSATRPLLSRARHPRRRARLEPAIVALSRSACSMSSSTRTATPDI